MKRYLATVAIAAVCSVPLRADVTIVQTMAMEGGAAAMAGMANSNSKMTTRIKGLKARTDMEIAGMAMSTIADLVEKQAYLLRASDKTATLMSSPAAPSMTKTPDVTLKPTGLFKTIQNQRCDEYVLSMTLNMADMAAGQQMPPGAAEMMKDVRMIMNGSLWIAPGGPGSADYVAFQKAAASGGMAAILGSAFGGQNVNKMMSAIAEAPGIPYLSEMTMTVEGSGEMAEAMKQMGSMKVTTTVASVSVEPISDDTFKVPADYKIVK